MIILNNFPQVYINNACGQVKEKINRRKKKSTGGKNIMQISSCSLLSKQGIQCITYVDLAAEQKLEKT